MTKLSDRAQYLLEESKALYSMMSEAEQKEAVTHLEKILDLNEQGEEIGFLFGVDYVSAAEAFLKDLN